MPKEAGEGKGLYRSVPFRLDRLARVGFPAQSLDDLPQVLEMLGRACATNEIAAALFDVDVDTFKRELASHPELARAWAAGHRQTDLLVIESLKTAALKGDVRAITFWLSNRQPEAYSLYGRNQSADLAKPNGGRPAQVDNPLKGLRLVRDGEDQRRDAS